MPFIPLASQGAFWHVSVNEYIKFLYIALGSLGESVSSLHAYQASGQITEAEFQKLDNIAYKLENGLLKLI